MLLYHEDKLVSICEKQTLFCYILQTRKLSREQQRHSKHLNAISTSCLLADWCYRVVVGNRFVFSKPERAAVASPPDPSTR